MRNVLGPIDPVLMWRQTSERLLEFFASHL
jgi:hypothetical protein